MSRQHRKPRPDGIDAEALKETIDSAGWQLYRQRVEKERDRKIHALTLPKTEIETATLRGAIAAHNDDLRIPEILKAESKEPKT